jgi:hypothetical protein
MLGVSAFHTGELRELPFLLWSEMDFHNRNLRRRVHLRKLLLKAVDHGRASDCDISKSFPQNLSNGWFASSVFGTSFIRPAGVGVTRALDEDGHLQAPFALKVKQHHQCRNKSSSWGDDEQLHQSGEAFELGTSDVFKSIGFVVAYQAHGSMVDENLA